MLNHVVPSFFFVSLLLESFVPLVNNVNSTLKMIPLMFLEEFLLDNSLGLGNNFVNVLLRLVNFCLFDLQNHSIINTLELEVIRKLN